ncbi:MAG TPA: class I lanthipeptide [Thermoanaerobaculia bacterium]|jgi:hypothetical protein|nr:class I lanthipeptide [Thermoanaerobaculia bacterium]
MKKSLKSRLTLNRETLRNLTADQMSGAQGGAVQANTTGCNVVPTVFNCPPAPVVSQTCPTRCGQWYCYAV